jgi:hypothetical protein
MSMAIGYRVRNVAQSGLARQVVGDTVLHLLGGVDDLLDGQLAAGQPIPRPSQSRHQIPTMVSPSAR